MPAHFRCRPRPKAGANSGIRFSPSQFQPLNSYILCHFLYIYENYEVLTMLVRIRPLFHHLLKSTVGRTFFLSLLLWFAAFTYCRKTYFREPHSAFFQSEYVYDLQYSLFREKQALTYISSFSTPSTETTLEGDSEAPEICAAFATIRREGKQYIDAAIGSLLEGLTENERKKLYLYVLFANTKPEVHESWNATWIREVADEVGSYVVSADEFAHLKELEEKRDFREKGV
jgi:hypothetical protein